jgi:signal transduction histidine kinase
MNKKYLFLAIFVILQAVVVVNAFYAQALIEANNSGELKTLLFFGSFFTSILIFFSIFFVYKTLASADKLKKESAKIEDMAQNLRAINRNFAGVLNSINAIIYVSDLKNSEIIFANNYAISKFGEIVGKATSVATKNPMELEPFTQDLITYEYYNEVSNEWYAATDKKSVWMDGQGVKISICLDISDRKSAEDKLKEINERLQDMIDGAVAEVRKKDKLLIQQSKMAAMGEMIGAIAHQWRQPLNALGLMIQDLRLSYQLNDLNDEYMEKTTGDAMGQVRYMSKTIDDFRNFFRPDKPKAIFNIQETILDVLKIASSQLSNAKIEVITDLDKTALKVDGYENEFKQVVLNLITNAKDAIVEKINDGGKLEIGVSRDAKKAILTVTDNGGGIRDDVLEKIFEPYFTTKDQGKGTGIGLYMCKMIIEDNMNGSIFAFNVDDGARFQVELALADNEVVDV